MKTVEALVPRDFTEFPIWEYTLSGGILGGESIVEEVREDVITHLNNRILGTHVMLHNSRLEFCALERLDLDNSLLTEHFLGASFYRNGAWFHLRRYHDFDYDKWGPEQLALFLGLNVDDIFPMKYDLSRVACLKSNLVGFIQKRPPGILDKDDLIQLALKSRKYRSE
jgi:hypothetical protein